MQIGFKQDSYAVRESDGTVTVCVNSTTRTFNVPVTLETLDTGTAQGMCSYCFQYSLVIIYHVYYGMGGLAKILQSIDVIADCFDVVADCDALLIVLI